MSSTHFLSYRIGERLQFRVGRMKTPYLYEYFSIAEGDLIAPERSMYAGNLAGNRQDGAMAIGELFEGRLGYAVGIFNGPRNSFQDYNGAKDFIGYVNSRPFLTSETFTALKYLNIGGSFDVGYQNNPSTAVAFSRRPTMRRPRRATRPWNRSRPRFLPSITMSWNEASATNGPGIWSGFTRA